MLALLCAGPDMAMQSPARAEPAPRLVVLGDSLVAGFELPARQAFPARLEQALRAKGVGVEIVNAGVSGDTASGGLARLDWSVPDGTDGVIVELGANDALRGLDPKITRAALEEIVRRLKARGLPVLLCGMRAPRNLGEDYAREFDRIFPDLAKRHDLLFFPFFLEGIAVDPKFTLPDRLHPNAAGVDLVVKNILPYAEALVARARKRAG